MKPKIIHLLDDHNVGGVMRWIEAISASALKEQFEFQLVRSQDLATISDADLILYHNSCAWKRLPTLLKLKRKSLKTILYEHHYCEGFEQLNVSSLTRFRTMLKLSYQLVDRVVAVSYGQSDWMRTHQLVPFSKLEIIPVRVNLDHLLDTPEKQLQKPFVLGAYGRFSKQKGFDTLLKAMQQVSASDILLYLGGYGEDEAELKALAVDRPNIKFWGSVKDVAGFLSACDAIAIPSRWEPGGVVCGEAKAAGKPLIVSQIDGLTEQVQSCGLLVQPDAVNQLATAINEIAASTPDQLQAWGEAARSEMQDAWQLHVASWEDLIQTVLGTPHRTEV